MYQFILFRMSEQFAIKWHTFMSRSQKSSSNCWIRALLLSLCSPALLFQLIYSTRSAGSGRKQRFHQGVDSGEGIMNFHTWLTAASPKISYDIIGFMATSGWIWLRITISRLPLKEHPLFFGRSRLLIQMRKYANSRLLVSVDAFFFSATLFSIPTDSIAVWFACGYPVVCARAAAHVVVRVSVSAWMWIYSESTEICRWSTATIWLFFPALHN